jgi:hypothetical protein
VRRQPARAEGPEEQHGRGRTDPGGQRRRDLGGDRRLQFGASDTVGPGRPRPQHPDRAHHQPDQHRQHQVVPAAQQPVEEGGEGREPQDRTDGEDPDRDQVSPLERVDDRQVHAEQQQQERPRHPREDPGTDGDRGGGEERHERGVRRGAGRHPEGEEGHHRRRDDERPVQGRGSAQLTDGEHRRAEHQPEEEGGHHDRLVAQQAGQRRDQQRDRRRHAEQQRHHERPLDRQQGRERVPEPAARRQRQRPGPLPDVGDEALEDARDQRDRPTGEPRHDLGGAHREPDRERPGQRERAARRRAGVASTGRGAIDDGSDTGDLQRRTTGTAGRYLTGGRTPGRR